MKKNIKKTLTITWDTETSYMFTSWSEGLLADNVLTMCKFATKEAKIIIEEEETNFENEEL